MTFVQIEFCAFFAVLFAAYWAWPRRRWQNLLLTVLSAVFYGWVHPWFLGLLAFSALLDYGSALGMERWPGRKKALLVASLVGNLGLLGVFKYYDFFVTNVADALGALGIHASVYTLGLALPVGISFYTFQTLSYSIDVYQGRLRARRDFLDYCTFIVMFPHLVAGPVMKARDLLPQVEGDRRLDLAAVRSGLTLALWGAAKKIMVADTVSLYVDRVFAMDAPPAPMVAVATLGFAIQILADFSGYTDIARGTARMLGFELTVNFKHPYLATNPSDFWRRWHVSFSSWIHEYVYLPLRGGTDTGEARRTAATWGSMLASGLWHGASWNYVVWGAYHAALLTLYRLVGPLVPDGLRRSRAGHAAAVTLMFTFTLGGWLLFRETRLDRLSALGGGHPLTTDETVTLVLLATVVAQAAVPLLVAFAVERWVVPRVRGDWLLPAQTTAWAVCAACIVIFARDTTQDFIYFQF